MKNFPFSQKEKSGSLIREFSKDVNSSELVWHRDRLDREVLVKSGTGWMLQVENQLPFLLEKGKTYYILKNTYHRVIKGKNNLVVEIKEKKESKMKITNEQLRNIIKEEKAKILKEQAAIDSALVSNKLLEGVLSSLEKKLMSEMRLDPEEVDAFAIDFMNRVGSNIETMLVNLLEGRYREEY